MILGYNKNKVFKYTTKILNISPLKISCLRESLSTIYINICQVGRTIILDNITNFYYFCDILFSPVWKTKLILGIPEKVLTIWNWRDTFGFWSGM